MAVVPIGRLGPDATLEQARDEIQIIAERVERADPKAFDGNSVQLSPYSVLGSGSPIHGLAPRFMAAFSIVAGLTLVIACANVGNLMLARAIARRRGNGGSPRARRLTRARAAIPKGGRPGPRSRAVGPGAGSASELPTSVAPPF